MDIKIPEVGESIFEAQVGKWHKADGAQVVRDELLCELETDKISLELNAEADGVLHILVPTGETVKIGSVIGSIDAGAAPAAPAPKAGKTTPAAKADKAAKGDKAAKAEAKPQPPVPAAKEEKPKTAPVKPPVPEPPPVAPEVVRSEEPTPYGISTTPQRDEARTTRQPLTPIRRRIAERLLAARQQTAMLTTFNEADLSKIIALRHKHGPDFEQKHGVPLGLMSFFVKATVEALREHPEVNARLEPDAIVFQNFYDIGIAIGGDKGLVVPILRSADTLHFAAIEQGIRDFAAKVKTGKLALSDLEGGTFTITNGGVYGSLLSTPILNPPQSAVLGMHAIQERPVVRDGQIVARPMMYLALSYDHRIIDGRQAVTFLKRLRALVEEPEEMLLEL